MVLGSALNDIGEELPGDPVRDGVFLFPRRQNSLPFGSIGEIVKELTNTKKKITLNGNKFRHQRSISRWGLYPQDTFDLACSFLNQGTVYRISRKRNPSVTRRG
jgi:hypothetical protein